MSRFLKKKIVICRVLLYILTIIIKGATLDNLDISPLITEEQIKERISKLGAALTDKFKNQENVVAVCVLKGALMFFSDLVREIELDIECDFLGLSSYHNSMQTSGEVKLTLDLSSNIEGKDVIIVEDIVDTGLTMNYLERILNARKPKSITKVALLFKPDSLKEKCDLDHVGFEIPSDFVVGYGLDYGDKYRNLPYIGQVSTLN